MNLRYYTRCSMKPSLLLAVFAAPLLAHEIAGDVRIQAYVKPDGQTMRLVLRAPLKAMRDIEFPKLPPAYLDIERSQPFLRDAATMWLTRFIDIYEEDRLLRTLDVVAVQASLESDKSFTSYQAAMAHVKGPPLPANINLPVEQAMVDMILETPIQSADCAVFHPSAV